MSDYDLDKTLLQIDNALKGSLEDIGKVVEIDAKATCPVRTGRLKASITHDVAVNDMTVSIGSEVFYAPFQEVKKHYLENACESNKGQFLYIIADNIVKGVSNDR